MRSVSDLLRPAVTGLVLLGCSDGSPPTQPDDAEGRRSASPPRVSADVVPASGTATIYACYIVGKGIVYRIKVHGAPNECAKNDVEFTIDQGVPGPEGPRGPEGPQGTVGPQGAAGPIDGVSHHAANVTLPADRQFRATCPAGKSVLNFGWEIPSGSTASPTQIWRNRPAITATQTEWLFGAATGTVYNFFWTCAFANSPTIG